MEKNIKIVQAHFLCFLKYAKPIKQKQLLTLAI